MKLTDWGFWRRVVAFLALYLAASGLRDVPGALNQAIIWLPTGIAVAGVWLVGSSLAPMVALAALTQRLWIGYGLDVATPAALGATAEAILGLYLLRRLAVGRDFSRLRDVAGLAVVAAVAPLASIAFSALGRSFAWARPDMPFYSGWDGWWRMNALGILTVVPLASTWLGHPIQRPASRSVLEAAAMAGAAGLLIWTALARMAPGPTALLILFATVFLALYAAVRFGPRGAISLAVLSGLGVSVGTSFGLGPFMTVPMDGRHIPLQVFELCLISVPLVFGALVAEREANAALRSQSEALQRAFRTVLPDAAYRIDADGWCLEAHRSEVALTGPPIELEPGQHLGALAPDAALALVAAVRAALSGHPPTPVEFAAGPPDHRLHLEARFVRLDDREVLGFVRNITTRKREELVLGWEAEMLERIATGTAAPEVVDALVRGIERWCPGGICSVLLVDAGRLYVVAAPSLPPEHAAALEGFPVGPRAGACGTAAWRNETVYVQDIASDPLFEGIRHLMLPQGLLACWSVPIRAPTGEVLGTFATYYREARAPSSAEIRLAERAAVLAGLALDRQHRESLLASINRNVSEGIFRTTPDRGLLYANDAFARMFGFATPADALAAPATSYFQDGGERAHLFEELAATGTLVSRELACRRKDGTIFPGLLNITAVRGPDGRLLHYDGAIADITARKALEDQLRQAQKMEALGKLAGGVAHDFNNLLTVIAGYAESLRAEVPPDSEASHDAEQVLAGTARASALTRQLLAYSRRQVLQPQVVELAETVDHLGDLLRRLIGEDVALVTVSADGDTRVRVDRGQIEQVILNLAVNARDAMPEGGTLTITTQRVEVDAALAALHPELAPGPYVAMSVRDSGVGMSDEVRIRAFDPFFTTKELGKGTGLGLSTVYGIVSQSGGGVWIESQPGAGTTVRVYLPRIDSPVDALPSLPRSAPAARGGAKVLLVEDEEAVRRLARRALSAAGYEVLEAGNGSEALEVSRAAGGIDVLVTDVVMPRMGGLDLARQLLPERPQLRVLFTSGYPNDALQLRDLPGLESDFLPKPFALEELVRRVRTLLAADLNARTSAGT